MSECERNRRPAATTSRDERATSATTSATTARSRPRRDTESGPQRPHDDARWVGRDEIRLLTRRDASYAYIYTYTSIYIYMYRRHLHIYVVYMYIYLVPSVLT